MPFHVQNLWSQIFCRSTERISLISLTLKEFGESKICKTNIAVSIHKHIFWLQIPMDDILLVKVAESEDNLRSNELDSWFLESFLFIYIVVNVSSW